ncbi:basic 7S globulin 2-like [Prunus yedoensis var. nudiflora]|uniref:Basic 7S globulin 2-like n=1 Tax=Prunus yedoensis var. nudiflora TaxID=2094558 RepID=A0A315A0Q6_PRUYE|nr:basic 7S globulin 2-like [Prunus yedoensis var. nudiflora]
MASSSFHCLILFSSLIFNIAITPSLAKTSFKPKALVLPVAKDSSTLQYTTTIKQRTPLVPIKLTIDLGGQSLWPKANLLSPTLVPQTECYSSPRPGCYNNTCDIFPDNPFAATLTGGGQLGQDVVSLHSTNGSNPGRIVSTPNLLFSCGDTSLLDGLAKGAKGHWLALVGPKLESPLN